MTDLALVTYAASTGRAPHRSLDRDDGYRRFLDDFDDDLELARLNQDGILWVAQAALPDRLRSIHDAPRGLFVRANQTGRVDPVAVLDGTAVGTAIAVVGSRACSEYAAEVARSSSMRLAEEGATIVSGLARGVDAWAHRGALERDPETWDDPLDARTIAVLGCGIDITYPRAHATLADAIVERGGLVVSEYPPGVAPAPWRFPARNRIVAGLSHAVLVVEARERSGSLITVDLALEAGRQIFAVPGEIGSGSAGSNELIRSGAATAFLGDPQEILG